MILPFQNLKVMLNTSRDSTITPEGLISNRRLSTLSTLLPQYQLCPLCFELNHVMIEILLHHLYWASLRGYISLKGNHLVHICFDNRHHHRRLQCCFHPFLLVETGIAGYLQILGLEEKARTMAKTREMYEN